MPLQQIALEELQKILAHLEECQPPPLIGSEAYYKDQAGYGQQCDAIRALRRRAEVTALMVIPDEIRAVFKAVEGRYYALLFPKPEGKEVSPDGTQNSQAPQDA